MTGQTAAFDEVIHAPHRLRICAMLAAVDSMEFGAIRDDLRVADSVLSKQLKVLVEAGYVQLDKPQGRGGKVRTWAHLTRSGRAALAGHLAELRRLTSLIEAQPEMPDSRA
ncbi:MAG: transcriptional regulator [Nocardioides sp.]